MDKLNLMVSRDGEYAPRFYEMTGGSFDKMLDAVKALPYRKYVPSSKIWNVDAAGIGILQAGGYSVEALPDLRLDRGEDDFEAGLSARHICPAGSSSYAVGKYSVSGKFQLREAKRMRRVGRIRRLVVEITEDQVQTVIREQNAELVSLGFKDTSQPLPAIRRICARAAEEYATEVVAQFAELTDGRRDEDTIYRAITVLKQEKKI